MDGWNRSQDRDQVGAERVKTLWHKRNEKSNIFLKFCYNFKSDPYLFISAWWKTQPQSENDIIYWSVGDTAKHVVQLTSIF